MEVAEEGEQQEIEPHERGADDDELAPGGHAPVECAVDQRPEAEEDDEDDEAVAALERVEPVDIGDLGVGDSMTVADVPLPEGVVAITDADSVIASIRILAEQPEDAEVAPEAAEGEPQIIGRAEQDAEEPKKED